MASARSGSDALNLPARFLNMRSSHAPEIKIAFDGGQRTYSTLDQLQGNVAITASRDTPFADIEIDLVGTSRTYVERLTTTAVSSGRSEAFHQFLKLQQPRLQECYPENKIMKAGETYKFPFVFVIPQQLLPRVCQHKIANDSLRHAHLQLPPTFGDKDARTKDDMVPDMASVRYGVFTRISEWEAKGEELVKRTVASKARRIRVVPRTMEQPPIDVRTDDEAWCLRKEKKIRKSLLKGKSGTLVMEASEPPAVHSTATKDSELQSKAAVMLRFDPCDANSPRPRLGSMSSKLVVQTYFACTAREHLPYKSGGTGQMNLDLLTQGLHEKTIDLPSRSMANIEWTKHDPAQDLFQRRDSALSLSGDATPAVPEPSESYKQGQIYWTAKIQMPVIFPNDKTFLPTFHSCLISRVYQLRMELSVQGTGIGGSPELKIPVQITSDIPSGDAHRGSVDSNMETDVDEADVTDFFDPRPIRTPSDHLIGRSRIGSQAPLEEPLMGLSSESRPRGSDAPPGYSSVVSVAQNGRRRTAAVR